MLKKVVTTVKAASLPHPWRMITNRQCTDISSFVDSSILRSLKEHYLEVSKWSPPPKVSPPSSFTIVKGALDSNGPVLRKTHGEEEINISVMRMSNIMPGGGGGEDGEEDDINQLFIHVDVSKPGRTDCMHFLCGLYPDAMGIHSVSLMPKIDEAQLLTVPKKYSGPDSFHDLEEKTKDALHGFIVERGVDESLFPFLQAWLYVKDHRNLMRWFKTVRDFITENKSA